MESVIKWNDIKNSKPPEFGWLFVIVKPVNYKECEDNNESMNDWITNFGFKKVWYNNYKFWDSRQSYGLDISDRVIYWAEMPDISMLL